MPNIDELVLGGLVCAFGGWTVGYCMGLLAGSRRQDLNLRRVAEHAIQEAAEHAKEVAGARMTLHQLELEKHQVQAETEALRNDAQRYRWLCEKFGTTELPCTIERILGGDIYVADGKASIDSAIEAAMSKEADHA